MKRKEIIIKKNILYFIVFLFLVSCNNKTERNYSLENGWQQHEFVMDGKRISFILPEHYINTEMANQKAAIRESGCYYDTIHVFYSTLNNENEFLICIVTEEALIDKLVMNYFHNFTGNGMVSFFEKRQDENNHVFYLLMGARVEIHRQSNYFLSHFMYLTVLEERYYACRLTTYDPVYINFSYEEKRKIIESVRIEDVTNAGKLKKDKKMKPIKN